MTFDLEKSSNKLLILLLLADLVFILIQVLYMMHLVTNPLFSIEMDRGYAEVYQYIKEYWAILLLFFIAIKRANIIYLAWFGLFIYILLDDSLKIHETYGGYLVHYFGLRPGFGLQAWAFGEIIISVFFGTLLFLFVGCVYLFSDCTAKKISKHLFILIMSLAFFGVIVDMVHVAIPWGKSIWGLIEDGGEMLVMSIIVWYVFDLKFTPKEPASVAF